jgi:endoglucanase
VSDIIHVAQPAIPAGLAQLGRRRFLAGMGVTTATLAGAVALGPDWGSGAPQRLPAAPVMPALRPISLAPRAPVLYGPADRVEWQAFARAYVTPEGRVIDTGNGNVSHSEGQGWGLMAAQAADDQEGFASILAWTTHNLQKRPYDRLHAWRYRPADAVPVADLNNATDGDLFIAGALARAAVRWNRPDYAAQAGKLAAAILGLVRQAGARTVLLPGAVGFETADAYSINPSYYTFALFPDLAALTPSPAWDLLRLDGLALILQGRFGRWGLPPDWLRVGRQDGAVSPAPGWPPRFSFDAIRVPLHLAWAGLPAGPFRESFNRYWAAPRRMPPAWVDLVTDEVAPYPASPGISAVAALLTGSAAGKMPSNPTVRSTNDYYSAGLVLLSRLAAQEGRPAM